MTTAPATALSKSVAVIKTAREKVTAVKIYSDTGHVTLSLDDVDAIRELVIRQSKILSK